MSEDTGKPMADQSQFLVRALQYLEDECTSGQLQAFRAELAADPAKRRAFVELSLSRAGLIEELQNRAQLSQQVRQTRPLTSALREDEPARGLGETMIMPALILPQEPADEEIIQPPVTPASPPATTNASRGLLRAAIVLMVLGLGALSWSLFRRTSPDHNSPDHNSMAINPPNQSQPRHHQ